MAERVGRSQRQRQGAEDGSERADLEVGAPSALRWHLRQNATGYAGLLLLGLSFVLLHVVSDGAPTQFAHLDARVRLTGLVGGLFTLRWIQARLVG